jgi:hypothetical protein
LNDKGTDRSRRPKLSLEWYADAWRCSCMTAETHSVMGKEAFDRHLRMYRRRLWGIALFVAHSLIIVLLLYYLFV